MENNIKVKEINYKLEFIGLLGTLCIIVAYILLVYKLIEKLYIIDIINILGSIFSIIYLLEKKALPPNILNIVWAIISIISFFKNIL